MMPEPRRDFRPVRRSSRRRSPTGYSCWWPTSPIAIQSRPLRSAVSRASIQVRREGAGRGRGCGDRPRLARCRNGRCRRGARPASRRGRSAAPRRGPARRRGAGRGATSSRRSRSTRSGHRETMTMTVVATPRNGSPAPAAMPIPAAAHRLAAVVRPRTDGPYLMIAPAPRNPMPVTIWAATRDGSVAVPSADGNPTIDSTVNSADPSATSRWVRIPAGWSWISRSIPMTAPRTAAISSRPTRIEIGADVEGHGTVSLRPGLRRRRRPDVGARGGRRGRPAPRGG